MACAHVELEETAWCRSFCILGHQYVSVTGGKYVWYLGGQWLRKCVPMTLVGLRWVGTNVLFKRQAHGLRHLGMRAMVWLTSHSISPMRQDGGSMGSPLFSRGSAVWVWERVSALMFLELDLQEREKLNWVTKYFSTDSAYYYYGLGVYGSP